MAVADVSLSNNKLDHYSCYSIAVIQPSKKARKSCLDTPSCSSSCSADTDWLPGQLATQCGKVPPAADMDMPEHACSHGCKMMQILLPVVVPDQPQAFCYH